MQWSSDVYVCVRIVSVGAGCRWTVSVQRTAEQSLQISTLRGQTHPYWKVSFICSLGRRPYGDDTCFANVAFFQSIPTPLNGSLRNFSAWRVSVGNTTKKFFGYRPPKKLGLKTTYRYFWQLRDSMATLSANISGVELDGDNRETALKTTESPLRRPKIWWTLVY